MTSSEGNMALKLAQLRWGPNLVHSVLTNDRACSDLRSKQTCIFRIGGLFLLFCGIQQDALLCIIADYSSPQIIPEIICP